MGRLKMEYDRRQFMSHGHHSAMWGMLVDKIPFGRKGIIAVKALSPVVLDRIEPWCMLYGDGCFSLVGGSLEIRQTTPYHDGRDVTPFDQPPILTEEMEARILRSEEREALRAKPSIPKAARIEGDPSPEEYGRIMAACTPKIHARKSGVVAVDGATLSTLEAIRPGCLLYFQHGDRRHIAKVDDDLKIVQVGEGSECETFANERPWMPRTSQPEGA